MDWSDESILMAGYIPATREHMANVNIQRGTARYESGGLYQPCNQRFIKYLLFKIVEFTKAIVNGDPVLRATNQPFAKITPEARYFVKHYFEEIRRIQIAPELFEDIGGYHMYSTLLERHLCIIQIVLKTDFDNRKRIFIDRLKLQLEWQLLTRPGFCSNLKPWSQFMSKDCPALPEILRLKRDSNGPLQVLPAAALSLLKSWYTERERIRDCVSAGCLSSAIKWPMKLRKLQGVEDILTKGNPKISVMAETLDDYSKILPKILPDEILSLHEKAKAIGDVELSGDLDDALEVETFEGDEEPDLESIEFPFIGLQFVRQTQRVMPAAGM